MRLLILKDAGLSHADANVITVYMSVYTIELPAGYWWRHLWSRSPVIDALGL